MTGWHRKEEFEVLTHYLKDEISMSNRLQKSLKQNKHGLRAILDNLKDTLVLIIH